MRTGLRRECSSLRMVLRRRFTELSCSGDSWRARVSHIPELQFNMTYMGMQINFGGEDRYDYSERKRNLEDAENIPPSMA